MLGLWGVLCSCAALANVARNNMKTGMLFFIVSVSFYFFALSAQMSEQQKKEKA